MASRPLYLAARLGDRAEVQALLDAGADLSASDSQGWTALHHAADAGNLDTTRALLDRGADPDLADRNGHGALQLAVYRKKPDLVHLLRARGADPLLGAAHLARKIGGVHATWFADLPPDLPEPPDRQAVVQVEGRIAVDPDARWEGEHSRLWKLLVPPRDEAPTVQGEVIRCSGRLADEAYRNGNMNWGPRYDAMCDFLEATFDRWDQGAAALDAIAAIRESVDSPRVQGAGTPHYRLSEEAVRYCLAHPVLTRRTATR